MGEKLMTYDQLISEMAFSRDIFIVLVVMLFAAWMLIEIRFSFVEHRWRKEEHKKRMGELSEHSDNEK